VLLTLLAVLALLLSSGTAISLTGGAPPAAPPTNPGTAALGAAPTPPPARADSAAPGRARAAPHSPSPTADPPPAPPPGVAQGLIDELTAMENEVVRITNDEREAAECGEVRIDERLRAAARGHSQDMAANDYFDHTGLDGRSPFDRMRDAGYPDPTGENIAVGYRTPADVMNGWMNSDGHRRNLLTCEHQAIGVGLAYSDDGRPYWTQVFGG
jgi:uncharacterized protein YkwD